MTIRRYDMRETAAPYGSLGQRLMAQGVDTFTDSELVQLITECTAEQAEKITGQRGVLETVVRDSVDLLALSMPGAMIRTRYKQAVQLKAAVELGRRTLTKPAAARPQFTTPRDTAAYLLPTFGTGSVEQFGIVVLDTKHRLLRTSIVSTGSMDSCAADPRSIFREAIAAGAAAIVLFHNHPSGDPTPSCDDVALTQRLVQAGEIMGVDVIDHMVLADSRYFSFREAGRL